MKDRSFKELQNINAAAKFQSSAAAKNYLNEKLPSLEEYFDFIKHKDIISNIELKTGVFEYPGIENAVYSLLTKYGLKEKCIISSFNHESILRMKKIDRSLTCGFLSGSWDIEPAAYLKAHKIECYHPPAYRLNQGFVEKLHAEGIKVNAWFGSVQTGYEEVLKTGLDIIITDYPEIVARLL